MAVFEACVPLGDKRHTRAVKREAVRLVALERMSAWDAAKALGGVEYRSIERWIEEFVERYRLAREANQGGANAAPESPAAEMAGGE
jgi:transposase-like protein